MSATEAQKVRASARRRANPERQRALARAWYRANLDGYARNRSDESHRKKELLRNIKQRADKAGIPFSLTIDNVFWPTVCPVLGLQLTYVAARKAQANSASIGRLVPALGYVPSNVMVVSFRANVIKSDATADELEKVAAFCRTFPTFSEVFAA